MESMKYISVKDWAERYGVSERTVRNYCATGKIEGAFLVGKTWNIPAEAQISKRRIKEALSPLLKTLREQKSAKLKGGIYHRIQIDLTYNSNHIEGSPPDPRSDPLYIRDKHHRNHLRGCQCG